jgi:hypothetical protein
MPRPNPPRKRPRRRPDAVERAARAEVSLAKQTAQFKERNGAPEPKSPNAKPQPSAKATRGGPPPRARRIDQPFVPWAKRSYLIFVALMAVTQLALGAIAYLTSNPSKVSFGVSLLAVDAGSLGPLVAIAAALVAAQITKYVAKESRSLRFMESAIAGVVQYFLWTALFVGLIYLFGFGAPAVSKASTGSPTPTATALPTTPASPSAATTASPSAAASSSGASATAAPATPAQVAGLALVDVLSFVVTFYIYPPLYRRIRVKPPPPRAPRAPKEPDPKQAPAKGAKTNVDKMDDTAAQEPKPKDPTP